MRSSTVLLAFLLFALTAAALRAEVHTFTDTQGRLMKGELVSISGEMVTLKREDGAVFTVKASIFSQADVDWLHDHGLPRRDAPVTEAKEVEGVYSAKFFTLYIVAANGDSGSPTWGRFPPPDARLPKGSKLYKEGATPDNIMMYYQKAPAEKHGPGIFIQSAYYPYWDHPETSPVVGEVYLRTLHDEDYHRKEKELIEALRSACDKAGVALYVNADLSTKRWRVLVEPKKAAR